MGCSRFVVRWAAVVGLLAAAGFAQSGGNAAADTAAMVSVVPHSQHPSGPVVVTGQNFLPDARIAISLDGSVVAYARTDTSGSFDRAFILSAGATPGLHLVGARSGGGNAETTLVVRTNWQMMGMDTQQRNENPWENVLTPSNVSSVAPRWLQTFGTSQGSGDYSSPTVVGGALYTSVSQGVEAPTYLVKIDATTGAVLWARSDAYVVGSPIVHNQNVYWDVGGEQLLVTSAKTGAIVGYVTFPGGVELGEPLRVGSTIILGSAAVDLNTLSILWSGLPRGLAQFGYEAYDHGRVFLSALDARGKSYMAALDATDGRLLWFISVHNESFDQASPVIDGGRLFVSAESTTEAPTMYAFSERTGQELWSLPGPETYGSIAVNHRSGLIFVPSFRGDVYALNEQTGVPRWTTNAGVDASTLSGVVVANGVLYVANPSSGVVVALNTVTGQQIATLAVGLPDSLAVVNGNLYVGEGSGHGFADYGLP